MVPAPNAVVLVRGLEYGPGVAPVDHGPGLLDLEITYRFPAEYTIDLERWFDDSKLLVDLLSIAARVPLLSRTCHVRLAKWIEEIDPNLGFGTQVSGGPVSDVWPKGCDLAEGDAAVSAVALSSRTILPIPAMLASSFFVELESPMLDSSSTGHVTSVWHVESSAQKVAPATAGVKADSRARRPRLWSPSSES